MRHSARHLLLVVCLFTIAGCGSISQASPPPPLIFPTTQPGGTPPPAPLSVYFATRSPTTSGQNSVFALDALTGKQRWRFDLQSTIQSGPFLQNNTIYFSTNDQKIYALNTGNNTIRWTYKTDGVPSLQLLDNNILYTGLDSSNTSRTPATSIYAINVTDGTLHWKAPIQGLVSGAANNIVYINATPGPLYALNANDGSQRWTFNSGSKTSFWQTANGLTYALSSLPGSRQGTSILYALNSTNGSITWRYPKDNNTTGISPLTIQSDIIYLTGNDNGGFGLNTVYALNARDGSERWHTEVSPNASIVSNWLVDNTLYLGANDSTIYALDPNTGTIKWHQHLGSNPASIQLLDQGVLYISIFNEGLTAAKASDGSILWRYRISGGFILILQLINGQLYGAYGDPNNPASQGYLFSINSKDGTFKWRYPAGPGLVFPVIG